MAMVARGHGGDNDPPNDDRPWEPPSIHKNAKGRKKGFNAKLIKKFKDGEKKKLPIKFDFNDLRTTKPIGLNRRDFTGLIGNEIERSVPLCYESWEALPDKYKETLCPACSFMLCDLDFEPSSLPSCDLMSLTNMLILLHYLESFKSELAEVFVFQS
ncbi:hypothetical protein Tco_0178446 [Tanacetum coccineum]